MTNRYKVEIIKTHTYVVEAMEKAHAEWYEKIEPQGIEHHHENSDPFTEIGAVYGVANTDD
jgi:hypothetical protein